MKSWIKTLLLWLVMAALPVQGFAAAVQLSCGGARHAPQPAAAADQHQMHQSPQSHQLHPRHELSVTHHAQAVPQFDAHLHHEQGPAGHEAGTAHDGNTSCSACASCCLGVAMAPPPFLAVPSLPPPGAVPVSDAVLLPGYIPPSPERPPKHVSA